MTTNNTTKKSAKRAALTALLASGISLIGVGLGAATAQAAPDNGFVSPTRPDKFVAISWSPESKVFGHANNAATMEEARIGSLSQCQNHGGSQCVFVAWAKNGCAAVALSHDFQNYYGWFGPTYQAAKDGALARNGGGYIASWHCTNTAPDPRA